MQINLKNLDNHLKNKLAPVYLLHGDEILFIQETKTKLCETAYRTGFDQRELLHIDSHFNWSYFISLSQNQGLFSKKTIIELQNPSGKFDNNATDILLNYLQAPSNDLLLIICTPKLTSAQQKTRWYKAISNTGVTVPIWPIKRQDLPNWIQIRLRQVNITANEESIQLLADLTEGNLLATHQAILKLQLLFPQKKITPQQVLQAINDNARYNIFDLVNAILQGNPKRTKRILIRLQQEGVEPTLVLWSLTREIRILIQYLMRLQQGASLTQVIKNEWYSRQTLLKNALSRFQLSQLNALLQHACDIDQMIKGVSIGNVWDNLLECSLALNNQPLFDR